MPRIANIFEGGVSADHIALGFVSGLTGLALPVGLFYGVHQITEATTNYEPDQTTVGDLLEYLLGLGIAWSFKQAGNKPISIRGVGK
jgi:hypothetical protein